MKRVFRAFVSAVLLLGVTASFADLVPLHTTGTVDFSEVPSGTNGNPLLYPAGSYSVSIPSVPPGAIAAAPIDLSFGNRFAGQSPSLSCPTSPFGTGCVSGTPIGPLSLSSDGSGVFTAPWNGAGAGLAGSPNFFGSIAILLSDEQSDLFFDAGVFNEVGSTQATFYDRNGAVLATQINVVSNASGSGIQQFGLSLSSNLIAGALISFIAVDTAGWAIDNLTFSAFGQCDRATPVWNGSQCVASGGGTVPEPNSLALVGLALIGFTIARRRLL